MSDFKVGQRVEVIGKNVQGVIAFCGMTSFATGKWIGLILDEPKGKNNGVVQGHTYFQCDDNRGLFVRPAQVVRLDEQGRPIESPSQGSPDEASLSKLRRQSGVRRKTSPQKRPSSLSASSSRISLASSRQSLAGSRQSLMGSRQSLSGSRSQLASPAVEKGETAEQQSGQTSKRESFVETGFVETLRPHFTPGQALTSTPISSVEEKLNALQLQQELDNRNRQIQDLTEKLETLKSKRHEDLEKLKQYDKVKLELEQLLEFKTKIMEQKAQLARELQKAKQEARDAIEARESHAEEVADLAEAVEMATVDKEMAEEKAETLQLELEACKEKLEEVTLDLEILKTEMQSQAGGSTSGGQSTLSIYEIKQLEQQNARLRETLVRMRDLSAHDKHEHQKLLKELDQKKSEITELGRTKEKLSATVENMEQQIADLQEQVDAALGAEEMVVTLSEQKLTLEEKVNQLQEELSELEALQDMNEQLVESNAELEADLREELDMAQAATRQALRDRDAAYEVIADREGTINKFRELVHRLQEQSLDLQQRLEKETSRPVSVADMTDFKKMFIETKAHTKAIDLELRRVDVQQLQQHIKYLTSYMPESFMNRGGDYDAILILLLIPRLIHKTEILLGQIRDKFPPVTNIDRAAVTKGHSVEQYQFRCRLSYYIYALQTILHQYVYSLNCCKPEELLKVGATYPEMSAQEKIIDGFIELVKRDQLDENIPTDALEKCVAYFNTMYPVLMGQEAKSNQTQLLNDNIKLLQCASEGISNDAVVVRKLIEDVNTGDMGLLCQYVTTTAEQFHQQLKTIKRKLPPDNAVTNLGLKREISENLYQSYQHIGKAWKTLQDVVKNAVQAINASSDTEKGLSQEKIKDLAINASDKIYEQDDLGPVQSIKNSLGFILTQITQITQFLQDNEYEITTASKNEEKPIPPIQIRAETIKKELQQTKTLTSKLENKESDIKELRKVLKEKQEQLSEMTIRKELAEKKLGNVNKDYELTIEKLKRKLEEAHNNFKRKEKEFEETLDHLQTDIDSLENEKGEMKEKLKLFSKKAYLEGMSKSTSGSQLSSMSGSFGPNLPAMVKDSPLLLQEITILKKLFDRERQERIRLQSSDLKEKLDKLAPLPLLKNERDEVLDALYKEGVALKQEILIALATPKFPPMYKVKPGHGPTVWQKHFAEESDKINNLRNRAAEFQNKVAIEVAKRKFGGHIDTDFTVFPTNEMTRVLNESKSVNIGFVKIPKNRLPAGEKSRIIDLELDYENLQQLLRTLST